MNAITSPFAFAPNYRAAGWLGTIPVPFRKKFSPPKGFTGKDGKFPDEEQLQSWLDEFGPQNIALRVPKNVLGFDVDNYDGKNGKATIAAIEDKIGLLPASYSCSSRDPKDGGTTFYRVPADLGHVQDLGPGVEVIQYDYRYSVVSPSIHPDGPAYRWRNHKSEFCEIPAVDDLEELPEEWVNYLRSKQIKTAATMPKVTPEEETPLIGDALTAAREYTERYIAAKIGKMDQLPLQGYSALWDTTVFGVARDLVKLANSWWSDVSLDTVRVRYETACINLQDGSQWDEEMERKWVRAVEEITETLPLPAEVQRQRVGRTPMDATNAADFEDVLADTIGTGPLAGIFQRGTEKMLYPAITDSGYVPPLDEEGAEPVPVNTEKLSAWVDDYFWLYVWKRVGGSMEQVHVIAPDKPVARALERSKGVRKINTFTRSPLVRKSGTLLDKPGYDEETKTLYIPKFHNDLDQTTWDSAQHAREFLLSEKGSDGIFGQIPWVGEHNGNDSRATYLAMLLTPLLELICPSPWPLFAVTAPDRGSGKSLLSQCAQILYGGKARGMSKDPEEFRKAVTTVLTQTDGKVVCFDNIEKTVVNEELSRLLTEPVWSDRMLGANRNVSVPNDRVWVVTGNNITIGSDQRRRTVWIMLDANMPAPWERTDFREKDLKGWLERNWETVLSALSFMITEWMKAGSPEAPHVVDRYDEFGKWVRLINNILAFSGAEGRVGRSERVEGLIEDDAWAVLYSTIAEVYQGGTWSASDICNNYRVEAAIEAVMTEPVKAVATAMGRALGKRENQWIGGYRVVKAGKKHGVGQWQLESTQGFETPDISDVPSTPLVTDPDWNAMLNL